MRLTSLALVAVCVLGGGAGGCGGSADDWVPKDIDKKATLDQIGQAAYARLCTAFEDYVLDMYRTSYLIEAVCTAVAIETTTDAEACGDAIAMCKDNPPAEAVALLDQILDQAGCGTVGLTPMGCAATVAQVQECLDALGAEVDGVRFTLTCAAAGQTLDDTWWRIAPPGACTGLQLACP